MYQKIYIHSARGQVALAEMVAGDVAYIKSWEGADQADGSWIGVVYPASAFARQELAKAPGVTVMPPHTSDDDEVEERHYQVLPERVKAGLTIESGRVVRQGPVMPGALPVHGRHLAKLLHTEFGHPALHPDT